MKRRTPHQSPPRKTTPPANDENRDSRAILAAFLLNRFAGLMHQVVWSKLLTVLVGATAHAQAVVLAVFMGASSRRIAEVLTGLAAQFPVANAAPSRTARGRVPEARSAGLFEADYWHERLTKERDAARASQFARRVDELVRAGSW